MRKIYILNTTVLTSEGTYKLKKTKIINMFELISFHTVNSRTNYKIETAVGHKATAKIVERDLYVVDAFNRIEVEMKPGDIAICFKLRKKPELGVDLNEEEIDKIGYDYYLLERIE